MFSARMTWGKMFAAVCYRVTKIKRTLNPQCLLR